jgi:hypothetical protein
LVDVSEVGFLKKNLWVVVFVDGGGGGGDDGGGEMFL